MKRLFRILKRTVFIVLGLIALFAVVVCIYMQHPHFGAVPEGESLARVERSPHYKEGRFHNTVEHPLIADGHSLWGEAYDSFFGEHPHRSPSRPLPSVKTDLLALPPDSNVLVWFGHSSFYMQVDGVRFLVDPVFSGSASPIPGSVTAYPGTDVYTAADMPPIDYMLLSHDHYDHVDHETAEALRDKVKHVVCGLGVDAHYLRWGYAPEQLMPLDWDDTIAVKPGLTIHVEESQHASGRGFARDKSLWVAFFIDAPDLRIYYSGDGGRSDRFARFHAAHGAVDWAIMECGQYNEAWHAVHELPTEVVTSASDLHASHVLPVHHSKFTLAKHPWFEPLEEVTRLSIGKPYRVATPLIGQVVYLNDSTQQFAPWWKEVMAADGSSGQP